MKSVISEIDTQNFPRMYRNWKTWKQRTTYRICNRKMPQTDKDILEKATILGKEAILEIIKMA